MIMSGFQFYAFHLLPRELCDKIMSGCSVGDGSASNGSTSTRLAAPLQLAAMAEHQEKNEAVIKSVWIVERDESMVSEKNYFNSLQCLINLCTINAKYVFNCILIIMLTSLL